MWTIEPFNGVWLGVCFFFIILFGIESFFAQKKGISTAKKLFRINAVVLLIVFVIYKVSLFFDESYAQILLAANEPPLTIWAELPLQVCNIGMILLLFCAISFNPVLMGYCVIMSVPMVLMGCCAPIIGFSGYSLFLPRMAGYYFTHWMVVFCSLSIVSFKLYVPKKEDLKKICVLLFIIYVGFFIISMILRGTGIYPLANYGFTVEAINNAILQQLWKMIPYPFLYMLPLYFGCVLYAVLITAIFRIITDKKVDFFDGSNINIDTFERSIENDE